MGRSQGGAAIAGIFSRFRRIDAHDLFHFRRNGEQAVRCDLKRDDESNRCEGNAAFYCILFHRFTT